MGQEIVTSTTQSNNELFVKKLNYLFDEYSQNFGKISIYRTTQKPYHYIMKFTETAINNEENRDNMEKKRIFYQQIQSSKHIVKVEAVEIRKSVQMCIQKIYLDAYVRFYNFTLQDAIDLKIKKKKNFREGDLHYITNCLITVGQYYSKKYPKQYGGLFQPKQIYLTTEGYVKVYFLKLKSVNQPNQKVSNLNKSMFYNNQVVLDLKHKTSGSESKKKIKTEKDDLLDIAYLIIQLIFLNRKNQYLNEEDLSPKKDQINFSLNRVEDHRISKRFRQLINDLVLNTQNYTYDSLLIQLQKLRNEQNYRPTYCLRPEQDISLNQNNRMKNQESQIQIQRQENLRRLSLHNFLVPARITSTRSNKQR